MKLLYMGIFRRGVTDTVELAHATHLKSFNMFTQSNVAEMLTFGATTVAKKTGPENRLKVEEESNTIHTYGREEGIVGVIISDEEYPHVVAQQLLSKICDEFVTQYPRAEFIEAQANKLPFPELKDYIKKYQNPEEADSIMKIQKELDETKIILHKTIEGVLERGEKIDSLVAKSEGLSASSKMFYTQAKKQNSCCIVM